MELYDYSTCNCPTPRHHCDHTNHSCKHCCSYECCCTCHHNHCRKNLCDTDFSIRLGGLEGGLNFRLRRLLWCEAEFELDNGEKVKGTIVSVGSNFVEVLVKQSSPLNTGESPEKKVEEVPVQNSDDISSQKHTDEESELCDDCEERTHEKGTSLIFSFDKIATIQVDNSCHCHGKTY